MGDTLSDILIGSQRDLGRLLHAKRYIEDSANAKVVPSLKAKTLEAIANMISICAAKDNAEVANLVIILDSLLFIVTRNDGDFFWNKFGFELGNLTMKILSGIEKTEKFPLLFCRLLSSVNVICERSASTWQLVARPLLNVFINKRIDHFHLQKSLRMFKSISECATVSEISNFSKQNLHLLRGFSMLTRRVGDFLLQMELVELVFLYTAEEKSKTKGFFTTGNQSVSQLLEKLEFDNFGRDSRTFLNALNASLGCEKQVFSINCNVLYFGNLALSPLPGMNCIWMDVNQGSRRITISCADFLSPAGESQCTVLELPVNEVDKLKLEFGALSDGSCCCITMWVGRMSEMYQFTKGITLICTALISDNTRDSILEFVRVVEKLSEKIQTHVKGSQEQSESSDSLHFLVTPATATGKGPSRELVPLPIIRGDKEDKPEGNTSRMSVTSPLAIQIRPNDRFKNLRTYAGLRDRPKRGKGECSKNGDRQSETVGGHEADPNLQVHHVSSSVLDSRQLLNCTLNSSRSSCASSRTTECAPSILQQSDARRRNITGDIQGKSLETGDGKVAERRNYSRQIFEEWTNSSEDFILTQKFVQPEVEKKPEDDEKENKPVVSIASQVFEEKEEERRKVCRVDWLKQNKKSGAERQVKKEEEAVKTSLLDPNGYAYKRWKVPSTSERSNFWLSKLKGREKKDSKTRKDIFHFSGEDEFSDGSAAFRNRKTKKPRSVGYRPMKARKPAEKKLNRKIWSSILATYPKIRNGDGHTSSVGKGSPSWIRSGKENLGNGRTDLMNSRWKEKLGGGMGDEFGSRNPAGTNGDEPDARETDFEDDEPNLKVGSAVKKNSSEVSPLLDANLPKQHSSRILGSDEETDYEEEEGPTVPPAEDAGRKTPLAKRKNISRDDSGSDAATDRKRTKQIDLKLELLVSPKVGKEGGWFANEVNAVLEKVSLGVDRFLAETRKREVEGTWKYLKAVEECLNRMSDEADGYLLRWKRFEKCVEYFSLGCTVSDLNEKTGEEIESIRGEMEALNVGGKGKGAGSRLARFSGRLKDVILSKTKESAGKQVKEAKICFLENFLSSSPK